MDIQTLTTFFMWCTIINGGIFILWTIFFVFAPDFVYRIQSKWFSIPRETYKNKGVKSFLDYMPVPRKY